jgi:hypothetical protein
MPSIPRGSGAETAPEEQQAQAEEAPTTEAPAVPASDGATVEASATPSDDATGEPAAAPDGDTTAGPHDAAPRFRRRARMRRRLRYLRRLRELAFRDLGGLVFDLQKFGRERDDLVQGKLEALRAIDAELRTLETALDDRREYTDLREAGVAACPRCGELHDTGANFCPGCGTSLRRSVVKDAAPVDVTPAEGEQQPSSSPS